MILNRCYFTMWNTQFAQCVHSIWHSIDNSWVSVLPTSKRIDRKHSKYYSLGFLALYLVVVDAKTSLFTHIFSTDYSNFKITFALFYFVKFFFFFVLFHYNALRRIMCLRNEQNLKIHVELISIKLDTPSLWQVYFNSFGSFFRFNRQNSHFRGI